MPTDGGNDPSLFSTTRPANMIPTIGMRGIRFRFLGDTNGDLIDCVFFAIETDNDRTPTVYMAQELGLLELQCGTLALPAGGPLRGTGGGTELFCDVVVGWTPTTAGTGLATYANTSFTTVSHAANGYAEFMIGDVGNTYGIVPAFERGATATAGALFKLDI